MPDSCRCHQTPRWQSARRRDSRGRGFRRKCLIVSDHRLHGMAIALYSTDGSLAFSAGGLVGGWSPSPINFRKSFMNVRQVIKKPNNFNGDPLACGVIVKRKDLESDKGKLAERRGRKASGLRVVSYDSGVTSDERFDAAARGFRHNAVRMAPYA